MADHARWLIAAALLGLAPPAHADEMPGLGPSAPIAEDADALESLLLGEIPRVITAAAFREQLPEEAPAAVVVITAEDIRAVGARNLGEALERCAGIGLTGRDHMTIRGIGPTNLIGGVGDAGRILLLIDGVRINDTFTDSFTVGLQRGIYDVARIEIVKGPGSALYGTSAFAGVINVVTIKGADRDGAEGRARVGVDGTEAAFRTGGVKGSAEGSAYGRLHLAPGFEQNAAVAEVRGAAGRKGLSLGAGHTLLLGGLGPQASEASPSPARQEGYLSIQGERALTPRFHAMARASSTAGTRQVSPSGMRVSELRLSAEGRTRLRILPLMWATLGAEARTEGARLQENPDLDPQSLGRAIAATYGQLEVGPISYVTVTAGVRAERIAPSLNGAAADAFNQISPRVGVVATLPTGTAVKAFYGNAFQAPSLALLYHSTTVGEITLNANDKLTPEKLRSVEAEVSHRFEAGVTMRVNVFQNDIDDLITTTYTAVQNELVFDNFYEARVRGVEGEISYAPSRRLTAFANAMWLDAYNRVSYQDLPLIPEVTANVGVRAQPISRATTWVSARYQSARSGVEGDPLSPYLTLDPQLRVDARLAVDLAPRWQAALSVRNLFGDQAADFRETELVLTDGTEVWLELTFKPPGPGGGEGL